MTNYVCMLTSNSFILGDDGVYKATILSSAHGLGTAVTVRTAEHRNENCEYENVLLSYMVDVYGNVRIYVSEPSPIRIEIVKEGGTS